MGRTKVNRKSRDPVVRGIIEGYRSGLEASVASQLNALGVGYRYEEVKINYVIPASNHYYLADFILDNGIIVETKGRWLPHDRKKHLYIRQCNPELDIRFVFSNSRTKIAKGSNTTYAMWCERNGFKYADKEIPKAWLDE